MLRKPGHKLEKFLFFLFIGSLPLSLIFLLMHFDNVFILCFNLSLYSLLALYTYGNLSLRTKSRNVEKDMDIVGLNPDQVYDALLSFFSKKHGYKRMQILYSTKPSLIAVKLNSWMHMTRLHNPPGTVKLRVSPSKAGSKIKFEFDFSGFRNFIYALACIFAFLFFGNLLALIRSIHGALFSTLTLFGFLALIQVPFESTFEVKIYLRRKINAYLTQLSRKKIGNNQQKGLNENSIEEKTY